MPELTSSERIIARQDGAVGWLVFNNPERRNAVSLDMLEAIPRLLGRYAADDAVRVVVLAGAGDKAFVSGADISQFESERAGDALRRYEEIAEGAMARLQEFDKPLLAMIRGYCLGAGVNIANACDVRIAAEDARFGIPAARIGLGYRVSSTRSLVELVGPAYAREMLITGRHFSAAEAKDMGLVHRVVPPSALQQTVEEYCQNISNNAPLSIRTAKRIIRELARPPREFDAERCKAWVSECFASEDYAEGRRAFMEKRKPAFRGR